MIQKNTTQKTWPHNFDVLKAQTEINKLSSKEKVKASEIFAQIWPSLTTGERLAMGRNLKDAVKAGRLTKISLHSCPTKGSDNHTFYDIG